MRRRREKIYGRWFSHFEVRFMMKRASKAAAAQCGMTYKEWRDYRPSKCFHCTEDPSMCELCKYKKSSPYLKKEAK